MYNQTEGGSIGSVLTGVLGTSRMIIFLRKLRMKCVSLGLELYFAKAFVDDVSVGAKDPGKGYFLNDGCLQWSAEKELQDNNSEDDTRVAELIVSVANGLEKEEDIQMTFDTPSRNVSKMMPVLDLQIWVDCNQVRFKFYEKPMASDYVLQRWSALSWNTKKSALAGEVSRRLLNCSPELKDEHYENEVLDKFRWKLMLSGYCEKEREIIVREGRSRYCNIVKLVEDGKRPLYRPSTWNKENRAIEKKTKLRGWYGSRESVVFVPATPGEILRKRIEKVMLGNNFNVKVVESGGRTLRSLLQRSDISPCLTCWDSECPVLKTQGRGMCCEEGVVYRVWCMNCEQVGVDASMFGETGRTARIRCGEHLNAYKDPRKSSNLREHANEKHFEEKEDVLFGCEVVKRYPGDALTRQLDEAAQIYCHEGVSLNDKDEWVRPAYVRVRGERA